MNANRSLPILAVLALLVSTAATLVLARRHHAIRQ
jgi:hypothetical protein